MSKCTNYVAVLKEGPLANRKFWMPKTKSVKESFDFREFHHIKKSVKFWELDDIQLTSVIDVSKEPIHHRYVCQAKIREVETDCQEFTYKYEN